MQKAIILDIDNTLISTNERKLNAIHIVGKRINNKCLQNLTMDNMPKDYGVKGTLEKCKLSENKEVENLWFETFLNNKSFYENGKIISKPIEGAVDAVKNAQKKGYKVFYLTGRHHDLYSKDSMQKGTIDELETHGFPIGDDATLIMKTGAKARYIKDTPYKQKVITNLKKSFNIVATADDQPSNVQVFIELLPKAKNYAVETNTECKYFPKESVCIPNMKKFIL